MAPCANGCNSRTETGDVLRCRAFVTADVSVPDLANCIASPADDPARRFERAVVVEAGRYGDHARFQTHHALRLVVILAVTSPALDPASLRERAGVYVSTRNCHFLERAGRWGWWRSGAHIVAAALAHDEDDHGQRKRAKDQREPYSRVVQHAVPPNSPEDVSRPSLRPAGGAIIVVQGLVCQLGLLWAHLMVRFGVAPQFQAGSPGGELRSRAASVQLRNWLMLCISLGIA
ncbi:MAG: hypothetical protein V3S14_12590 [Anaerolineae bacterium]